MKFEETGKGWIQGRANETGKKERRDTLICAGVGGGENITFL
jgi:hypothetical protein